MGGGIRIQALINELAASGLGVLMISSELPEILGMSDRVLVMHGGQLMSTIDRADATPETVGAAMTQATAKEAAE